MREYRCAHPHPRIPGRLCNALTRLSFSGGTVEVECWRCNKVIVANFEEAQTEGAGLTLEMMRR